MPRLELLRPLHHVELGALIGANSVAAND
jgi:hypothetical protein